METLKLFSCINHDCVWPTGIASIVIARNMKHARKLLDIELAKKKLKPYKQREYTLREVALCEPKAIILCDGDY